MQDRDAELVYRGPSMHPRMPSGPILFVGRFGAFRPKVLEGFSRRVLVDGLPGVLVHGGVSVRKGAGGEEVGWEPSAVTFVLFERDAFFYNVAVIPGWALDDESLLNVAASLAPYEG